MFKQPDIPPKWVIKFNYPSNDLDHPRTNFYVPGKGGPSDALIDANAIKSLNHIQTRCEKLRDECLSQVREPATNMDERVVSVEENIRSLEKLLKMYSDFIKRYPPFNKPKAEED